MFIGKVAWRKQDIGKRLPCAIWGGSLPLVIPGERWSLSVCRRLLKSREPCLAGWGGWPSNMVTMSIRSILFRAVYKLSTAVRMHDGETHANKEKGKEERGSQDKQQYNYNTSHASSPLKLQNIGVERNFHQSQISCTHSWLSCPREWPTGWAVQSSAPAGSSDSPHGSYWCHPHWAEAHVPTLFKKCEGEVLDQTRAIFFTNSLSHAVEAFMVLFLKCTASQ